MQGSYNTVINSVRSAPPISAHITSGQSALLLLLVLLLVAGLGWWWNHSARKWLEKHGREENSPSALGWLTGKLDERPPAPLRYSEEEFQQMVADALDEVPPEFDKEWQNVAVIVRSDWPTSEERELTRTPENHLLLGSYSGVDRSRGTWSAHVRHIIYIYQPSLERLCGSNKELLRHEIRRTVFHELAHHLGMSHAQMKQVGL